MSRFIIRRLLLSIPVLLGVITLVFFLARVIPGDPCRAALGEKATDAICDAFNVRYGLDRPLPVQYVGYIGQVLTGDLGRRSDSTGPSPTCSWSASGHPRADDLRPLYATIVDIFLAARRRSAQLPADVATSHRNRGVSIPSRPRPAARYLFAVVLKARRTRSLRRGALRRMDSRAPCQGMGPPGPRGLPRVASTSLQHQYHQRDPDAQLGSPRGRRAPHDPPAIALGTSPWRSRPETPSSLLTSGLDYIRPPGQGVTERRVSAPTDAQARSSPS